MYAEGLGVVQDFAEAAKWWRKSDDPSSKGHLGWLYFNGQGVRRDFPEAYRLAKDSAERGSGMGQFVLGVIFLSGKGAPQNYQEGMKWLQVAARNGEVRAQQMLREQGVNW